MKLRPSSSKFWVHCAAQPRMVANVPEVPPGEPAMEGTCAAWVGEQVINGKVERTRDLFGASCPENGWVVDADMVYHVQHYVDLVRSFGHPVEAERFVRLNHHIEGTTDCWGMVSDDGTNRHLSVGDLKYGFGVHDPRRHSQASIYAGALVKALHMRATDRVTIWIFQPRAVHHLGPFRKWETTVSELMSYVREIEHAGENCYGPNPVAVAGPHCQDCGAAATCPALARALYHIRGEALLSQQRQLTNDELANELRFLKDAEKMINTRKTMVEAEAEARMDRGEAIRGWGKYPKRGQRRFKHDMATISTITGVDARSDKIATPAEMIRRGVPEATVQALSEIPSTGTKLAPIDENDLKRIFGL